MDRKAILEQAMTIVCSDREKQYGSPENNFNLIARLWEDYMGYPFTGHDVAVMMMLLKVARIKSGHGKEDSYGIYRRVANQVHLRHGWLAGPDRAWPS